MLKSEKIMSENIRDQLFGYKKKWPGYWNCK